MPIPQLTEAYARVTAGLQNAISARDPLSIDMYLRQATLIAGNARTPELDDLIAQANVIKRQLMSEAVTTKNTLTEGAQPLIDAASAAVDQTADAFYVPTEEYLKWTAIGVLAGGLAQKVLEGEWSAGGLIVGALGGLSFRYFTRGS